jgi:uncharacterized cupin superfamily protein
MSQFKRRVIDPKTVPAIKLEPGIHSGYPLCFPNCLEGRELRRLGEAAGLQHLAVALVDLLPGAAVSLPLWQSHEDEFFYVLEGEATLITDHAEEALPAGRGAGFAAGDTLGHQIVNRSKQTVRLLKVGNTADGVNVTDYAGADLKSIWIDGKRTFVHRNGEPYTE